MKKLFLLLMTVLTLSLCASAQTRTVHGTVVDATNDDPLIGVSVQAIGSSANAVTDIDGNFVIKLPASATQIKFSYVGYKEVVTKASEGMTVRMHPASELLNEVIAVAYGKSTRAAFTGSAAVVSSAEIENAQTSDALNAIKGKVAGVQITNVSGAPGQDSPSIRIRGISSISAGNSPLIIVDGTPYSGSMQTINNNDIESMTVLKDAASNALYGARGANGVILITTKRAKAGEATVTLDVKLGQNSRASVDYDYIKNPAMYYETYFKALNNYALSNGKDANAANVWANQMMVGQGADAAIYSLGYNVYNVPAGQALIGLNGKLNPNATLGNTVNYNGKDYLVTPDNWMDYAYSNSLRQDYNLSISKGTDTGDFYFSMGYLDNKGITPQSGFSRLTGTLSASTQAKSWLKASASMRYSHYDMDSYGSDEGSSASSGNPFAIATQVAPIYPLFVRNADGSIMQDVRNYNVYDFGTGMNAGFVRPMLNNSNAIGVAGLNRDYSKGNSLSGLASIDVKLPFDITFTSNNNVDLLSSIGTSFTNPYYGSGVQSNGSLYKSTSTTISYTLQQLLNWNRKFDGVHNVGLLAGHEYYKVNSYGLSGSRKNVFDPNNDELAGYISMVNTSSSSSVYNNEGFIFRGQYDYDNKYFASASFRRDASSRFHPKHRWGSFWSAGGAWILSNEDFMADVEWVDMLKVKASYGSQGNDNISNYLYVNTYELVNANEKPSIVPSNMGNEKITWETNGNFNAGVEFDILDSSLNGSVEGFYRKTSDMLFYFPLPPSMGWSGYYANIGDMANTGIEIDLHYTPVKTRDFSWTVDANLTWYKNEITRLPEERRTKKSADGYEGYTSGSFFYGEGLPLYSYYMPKFAGLNDKGESQWYQVVNKTTKDENGNEVTTEETVKTTNYADATQYVLGTSQQPVYGGFGTNLTYKGFDFGIAFNYAIGGKIFDGSYAGLMSSPSAGAVGNNIHADILKAWTPENKDSLIPRFQFGDTYSSGSSDRFLTNASYLSLQNINLGYRLPDNLVHKLTLRSVRVYASADNIWYWSARQGLDPRTGGANNTYYSPIRTISGGVNVTF